ncbi:sugar nucleotide-binding protein [Clostridium estertheticum]|uniref:SDR family oxidoreductase n=1 Tax=Clostridium estertheticum TaxID=238834 RepID=UPI001C6F25B6|nr:sugar nucleotide-binding protein [Clostridium estertheticum]MBW9150941.1 sugar nucleotide-binding protein [Clostridium estertheticum]WLC84344.1 sugar nucleotide-binding protein [Clostridium estertheticum]
MKKILLTGGNGFFCTRFATKYRNTYEILSASSSMLDVTDESNVTETIKKFKPDYVIHAAAIASTEFCDKNPELAYKINVTGSINVAKACKEFKAKMIFLSSEQVFNGNVEPGPYSEEVTPFPSTVYGENKLVAEGILKQTLDELWILRFTWLFGLPERNCSMSPNILWDTLSSILKGKKIKATPNEYRGLTYVYEVIDQFPQIFNLPYDTYHVGSQNSLNRYDICSLILKEVGLEHRIDELLEKDYGKYKNHSRDIRLCTDKIKNYNMNFSESSDGIKKCLKEFRLKL